MAIEGDAPEPTGEGYLGTYFLRRDESFVFVVENHGMDIRHRGSCIDRDGVPSCVYDGRSLDALAIRILLRNRRVGRNRVALSETKVQARTESPDCSQWPALERTHVRSQLLSGDYA